MKDRQQDYRKGLRYAHGMGTPKVVWKSGNPASTRTATLNVEHVVGKNVAEWILCSVEDASYSVGKSKNMGRGFNVAYNDSPATRNVIGVIVSERFQIQSLD